jgi:hypothetical protein
MLGLRHDALMRKDIPIVEIDVAALALPEAFMVTRLVAKVDRNISDTEARVAEGLGIKPDRVVAGVGIYRSYDDAAYVATWLQALYPDEVIVALGSTEADRDDVAAVWNRWQAWKAEHNT